MKDWRTVRFGRSVRRPSSAWPNCAAGPWWPWRVTGSRRPTCGRCWGSRCRRQTTHAPTGRYTHARIHELVAAVEGLPRLVPDATGRDALAATGTEGAPRGARDTPGQTREKYLSLSLGLRRDVYGDTVRQSGAPKGVSDTPVPVRERREEQAHSGDSGTGEGSYPAWIRTRNEGTKIPSVTSYTTG